jgi:hypothetical protein
MSGRTFIIIEVCGNNIFRVNYAEGGVTLQGCALSRKIGYFRLKFKGGNDNSNQ